MSTTIDLGRVKGDDGAPGRDGKDGLPAQIFVFSAIGNTVEATLGETVLTQTSETGVVVFDVTQYGLWDISDDDDGIDVLVDAAKQIRVYLSGPRIFGVEWDFGNPSPQLRRLQPSDDPNWLVNTSVTEEPTPAVNDGDGYSPFDAFSPWKGMRECNINASGNPVFYGNASFSREDSDVLVFIPEFYCKVVEEAGRMLRRYYVSDGPFPGFVKHPGSGQYLARYPDGEGFASVTGIAPLSNITRAEARAGITAKGEHWYLAPYQIICAIILLYLVEYAEWDSQRVIGMGIVGGSERTEPAVSGLTDGMVYHTGRVENEGENEYNHQIQYRHIEGLWGNIGSHMDCINSSGRSVYICLDPSKCKDDTSEDYVFTGISLPSSSGFAKQLGMSGRFPWAIIPISVGGSDTTYTTDSISTNTIGWGGGSFGEYYGGRIDECFSRGIMRLGFSVSSTHHAIARGARTAYIP